MYGYLDYIAQNSTPFLAQDEFLAAWAALKGIYRLAATQASGTVGFNGSAGVVVPSGSTLASNSSVLYVTAADYTVSTSAPVNITAIAAGAAGNAPTGIVLNLRSPIVGVTGATAASALTGGSDQELDFSLRSRMLFAYGNPPNGGSISDYVNWSLQVAGVTRAWAVQSGAGGVTVYIMLDQVNAPTGFPVGSNGGATPETRTTAATGDQLNVANWIYPLRPVTALVTIAAPTAAPIAFTISGLSPSTAAVKAAISRAIGDLFVRLGSPLTGNAIYLSDVNQAIESVVGIGGHFNLVVPAVPIVVAAGQLPTVGTIVYS